MYKFSNYVKVLYSLQKIIFIKKQAKHLFFRNYVLIKKVLYKFAIEFLSCKYANLNLLNNNTYKLSLFTFTIFLFSKSLSNSASYQL